MFVGFFRHGPELANVPLEVRAPVMRSMHLALAACQYSQSHGVHGRMTLVTDFDMAIPLSPYLWRRKVLTWALPAQGPKESPISYSRMTCVSLRVNHRPRFIEAWGNR